MSFLFGRTMQKIVALTIIFWILTTAGVHWDDVRWWAIFVLLIVVSHLDKIEGEYIGVSSVLSMSRSKLIKVKDFMDSVENGGNHSVDDLNKILNKEETKDE